VLAASVPVLTDAERGTAKRRVSELQLPVMSSRKFLFPTLFRAFACDQNSVDDFGWAAVLKMLSEKPLKIPLFSMASGRDDVDELLGISIEQLTKQVPFRKIPHRHDFYHLFWIESGNGTFMSDGRSYPVTRGSLIFVPPGQVHAWKWNDTLSGYVLCFEPALLFSGDNRPYRLLHDLAQFSTTTKDRATFQIAGSTYPILRAAFEDLASESSGSAEFRCDMLRSQVTALLIRLHRLCLSTPSAEVQGYSTQLSNRFLLLLEKEEGKLRRTSFYTAALALSARVLVDAVLTETGKSPSAWIRDRTLLEARRLLTYTDLTISEIAYRLNFRNVSYFVRFYRRSAGVAPGASRGKQG
jgi:AraC family transcriptional regulator, transcriptional activator of pobA